MAVSIFDENAPHDGTQFSPFDESRVGAAQRASAATLLTSSRGMNTSEIDAFRQGIELTTQAHRFKGLGAKIWSGNVDGLTTIRTFGQVPTFTDFENSIKFEELPRFNPVSYLELGASYPLPIVFNEGAQQNKETSLQPFTIPNRNGLEDNEGQDRARAVRASLEDGNPDFKTRNGRNSRIEQIVPFDSEEVYPEPFLDQGQEYWGKTTGSLLEVTGGISTLGLFKLNGDTRDHGSAGLNLAADLPITFSNGGPSPCTQAHVVSQSYGPILSSSAGTALALTGAMTMELLIYPSSSMEGSATSRYTAGHAGFGSLEQNNILYHYYIRFSDKRLTYWHQYGAGTNVTLVSTNIPIAFDKWNHLAFTRTPSGANLTVKMYVNGKLVRTTTVTAPTGGQNGSFVVGAFASGSVGTTNPDARFSSVRILDYPLTTAEIQQNVTSSLLWPRPAHNLNSIMVEGFVNEDERIIKPYDDVGNHKIIDQLNTNDSDLIKVLTSVSSSLNLDEDIREVHGVKSATAGGDVYGPGAARTGTDSIAYRGLILGS